jgi:cell division control protein 6
MPLSDPPDGKPVCRDTYLEHMARLLADFFTTGRARNLFIYGSPGTGKTICAKHVLAEAVKHASEKNIQAKTVYVNAGKTRNPYYTMTEIIKQLGINVPEAGWQMFRLKQTFEHVLTENAVLIAIDEVDSIILKEKEPLVYYLSRQPKTTLILISNNTDDITRLPERTLSTLQPIFIYTEPYTATEIQHILKQRAEYALKPNTITDQMLTTIANTASQTGDTRYSFQILLTAAQAAEKTGKQTIEPDDIASALEQENAFRKIKEYETLKHKLLKLKKEHEKN